MLQEGRNWHASYAARTYRHCMDCARAYSRRRYGLIQPGVKRRNPVGVGSGKPITIKRDWAVKNRAQLAQARRDRTRD